MNYNQYAPGSHKLIHHLSHLDKMVSGEVVAPIHVSIWPTVLCQRTCDYCCCIQHVNKTAPEFNHLNFEDYKNAVDVLHKYGTKAIEFSGGGEPTLWNHFEEAVRYAHAKGIKLSLITNGLRFHKLPKEVWSMFKWIRVSLHYMDHAYKEIKWEHLPDDVNVSCSYIITKTEDRNILKELKAFGDKSGKVVRIGMARPCTIEEEDNMEADVFSVGEPLLFSRKAPGAPKGCYMAWVRAAITWSGDFLPCPSIQLTDEFKGQIPKSFKVCHISNLESWLTENTVRDLGYRCKFCNCGKENNDLIHNLLNGGDDVEFV